MPRSLLNNIFTIMLSFAFAGSLFVLFLLFGLIAFKGISALSVEFITSSAKNFGSQGGIVFQILGSLLLVVVTALISFPIALGSAIYKSEYIKSKRLQKMSNILIYGLNGIPSIIFGIFGLVLFVNVLGTGISWFVGSIILAMMILPTLTLAAYQSINSVPQAYRDSSLALGHTKWQMITKVLLPQGLNGAITGLLIGLARAIGETAPIMFIATAFSGVSLPGSIFDPVSTLPTHILALAQQASNPDALRNAWGASFVLIAIVLLLSLSALFIRISFQKNQQY